METHIYLLIAVIIYHQTFTRFVEVGRVVLINYGENKGKICTVIDVVDAKRVSSAELKHFIKYFHDNSKLLLIRLFAAHKFHQQVLVDGPQSITGIHRQVLTLKRLSLTDVLITKLPRNATQKNLTKAWTVSFSPK